MDKAPLNGAQAHLSGSLHPCSWPTLCLVSSISTERLVGFLLHPDLAHAVPST